MKTLAEVKEEATEQLYKEDSATTVEESFSAGFDASSKFFKEELSKILRDVDSGYPTEQALLDFCQTIFDRE